MPGPLLPPGGRDHPGPAFTLPSEEKEVEKSTRSSSKKRPQPGRAKSAGLHPTPLGSVFIQRAGPQMSEMGSHWAKNKED